MFLVSSAAMVLSLSRPCLAQVDVVGNWSTFAKLGDILRDIANSDEALVPQTTAQKFRKLLTSLMTLLNSSYDAVKELSKKASAATCSVNEEVEARLTAVDSVKASLFDLSKLINELSGHIKPNHIREAVLNVADNLQQLAFDRSGWLGNIRRYCFLSPSERQRFLLQLRLGADAIYSLRQPILALHNHFER
jgi:methyl-accepting chemotaxis protein